MKSFDVKIDGEPYLFGERGGMSPGRARLEPGAQQQLGTIVFPSARHGFGQAVAGDPHQVDANFGFEVVGNALTPLGKAAELGSPIAACFSPVGVNYHDRAVATFFENDKCFIIFPRKIVSVTSSGTVATVSTAPVTAYQSAYTSVARWRGEYIIGIEIRPTSPQYGDNSQRYAYGHCRYDIQSDTFTNYAGSILTSHVAAGPNNIYRIVNYGRYRPPELYFGDDPTQEYNAVTWVGPILAHQGGYCTGLYAYGPHILMLKREGVMLGMDVGEVFSPLITSPQGFEDDNFGFNMKQYLHYLLVPNSRALIRFDPNTLQQADLGVQAVQNMLNTYYNIEPGRIWALGVRHTNEVWVVGQSAAGYNAAARGVATPEGFYYTSVSMIIPDAAPRGGMAVQFANGDNQLLVGCKASDGTSGEVHRQYLYSSSFLKLPTDYEELALFTSRFSADGAAAGLSVAPLQVRFWRHFPDSPTASGWQVVLYSDESVTELFNSNIYGAGPSVFTVPSTMSPRLGREFRVGVVAKDLAAGEKYRVDFPMALDYAYVPNTQDSVTIKISAASGQPHKGGGEWIRDSGEALTATLSALQGTVVAVEFESSVSWTVLVEQVSSQMIEPADPRTNSPSWLVTLECRRL